MLLKCISVLIIGRDAVSQDKKRQNLKLDNSPVMRLKTSISDGKVGMSLLRGERNLKTQSCHIPFATSLERLADISVKGVS